MADKPVVNGVVPFAPVLTEVTCVPPVGVELLVGKTCHLCPEIGPRVENQEENAEPHIGSWNSNIKGGEEDVVKISVFEVDDRFLANWSNVLRDNIDDQEAGKEDLE